MKKKKNGRMGSVRKEGVLVYKRDEWRIICLLIHHILHFSADCLCYLYYYYHHLFHQTAEGSVQHLQRQEEMN